MFKDFKGRELKVGDKVITYSQRYAGFNTAEVVAFTPKMVRIKFLMKQGSWEHDTTLRNGNELYIDIL